MVMPPVLEVVKVVNAKSSASTESTRSPENHGNIQAQMSNDAGYRFDNMELPDSVNSVSQRKNDISAKLGYVRLMLATSDGKSHES